MRLKSVITGSLSRLCDSGLLPELPPRRIVPASADNFGAAWSRKHVELATLGDISHPFYADLEAWQRAVSVVQAFRPPASPKDQRRFVIPHCFGAFAEALPLAQAVDIVTAAFKACALEVPDTRGMNVVVGRLQEKIKVRSLPPFYGNWLARREGPDAWERQITLELHLEAELSMQYLPGEAVRLSPVMTLALSAPAIVLTEALEARLAKYTTSNLRLPLPPGQLVANMLARAWHQPSPYLIR